MKYYKYKQVITEYTTLQIIGDIIRYDVIDGYSYCGSKDGLDLSIQYPECEVQEITFSEIEPILKNCVHMKMIDNQIRDEIKKYYSIDDEIKLTKKAITNPLDEEYLAMQEKINQIKNVYNQSKKDIGLIC